ncbi:hypothetical protein CHU93_02280 [Sandarakinorhabdus cyanobacteriorum]|uniref:Uncharacterized protein n=1 Tax=Sandarakinorhabdus cyanobacteriorum TaxID=1981098 RepID=A0A255YZQ4_9SPHN|nr:hypothetical protein [Sandarakinorhabdus cyanobacteriorum]OYQ34696.1 hypothetical protein CHU93_02280 [Sandarakinorhabdus cyanobacteriorum]
MRWWLWAVLLLIWPAAVLAQGRTGLVPIPADASQAPPLVLDADAPVPVWVNGLQVQLAVSTGTVDHITLNDSAVGRIGLSAAPADNTADLVIGGRIVLNGRHGKGWLGTDWQNGAGTLVRREYYWFPGEQRLPLAGTIGPFALPYWRVRVDWPVAATGLAGDVVDLPLIGGIDNAAYGVSKVGRQFLAVGVDVRMRRPLPLVTAATGADLAAEFGGRLVGAAWREEILLGISRPVRRLQLDRPLMIGPIRIDAVAVRQGGPRDATMTLAPGQLTPLDAEEDPEIMQVRGRILKQRRVARYIMLTRTQLEAAGCTSLLVDKAELRWRLACASPDRAVAPAGPTQLVPVAAGGPLIDPVLPQLPEVQLAIDQPVPVRINGRPLNLVPGEAGREGLMLNGRVGRNLVATRLAEVRSEFQARGQLSDALRRVDAAQLFERIGALALPDQTRDSIGLSVSSVAPRTLLYSLDVQLAGLGQQTLAVATWLETPMRTGDNLDKSLPHDGRIALAMLPEARLRLALGPAPAAGGGTDLVLPIADRSHDQSVMGVTTVPGIDVLFVGVELGEPVTAPLASMALGQDLVRLHGGRWAEPRQSWRNADRRLRRARLLTLATPLVVGPLRLSELWVEQEPLLEQMAGQRHWSRLAPWPDMKGIAGLERELRLPVPVLQAAGCHALVMDKPGRAWTKRCGPINAPPAP